MTMRLRFPGGVLRAAALVAAVLAGSGLASAPAAAVTASGCSIANVAVSTACKASIPGGNGGNVTATEMNGSGGVFGITTWSSLGKIDTTKAGGAFAGGFLSVTSGAGNASGTWSLAPGTAFAPGGSYALVLKGATANVAYLLDTAFGSGTWTNADLWTPNGKNNAGLSNMTLFGTATPAPIPLPAAAWLLLGGLGGIGMIARRRRTA